ncbi:hypothetical protein C8R44DRAFT_877232 [Mycena epipterygia]|nr:hypothetical protein C8R44DRAFT_877232 [Mycena epipterygia]
MDTTDNPPPLERVTGDLFVVDQMHYSSGDTPGADQPAAGDNAPIASGSRNARHKLLHIVVCYKEIASSAAHSEDCEEVIWEY